MVLLTVGANDIDFSGLVANVIIDQTSERVLFGRSVIGSVENAEAALTTKLPANFVRLRAALKPMVGGDLSRVVFVSYGHPAMRADGTPCAGGQAASTCIPRSGSIMHGCARSRISSACASAGAESDRAMPGRLDVRQS